MYIYKSIYKSKSISIVNIYPKNGGKKTWVNINLHHWTEHVLSPVDDMNEHDYMTWL